MRTTVAIPDDLCREIRGHLERLKQEAVARKMAEGYRAEARSPSLDAEWTDIETDGWS